MNFKYLTNCFCISTNTLNLNRINLLWTHTEHIQVSLTDHKHQSVRECTEKHEILHINLWRYSSEFWDPPAWMLWILGGICYPMIGSVYIQVCVTVQTRILQQSKGEYIKYMKGIMHKFFASLLRNTKIIGMIKWYLVMKFYCNFCEHFQSINYTSTCIL